MPRNAKITQIDPIYEEDGQHFRAVEKQDHGTEDQRQKAKRIFSKCRERVIQIIKTKPSLYNHDVEEWEEFADTENIIDKFMYKGIH